MVELRPKPKKEKMIPSPSNEQITVLPTELDDMRIQHNEIMDSLVNLGSSVAKLKDAVRNFEPQSNIFDTQRLAAIVDGMGEEIANIYVTLGGQVKLDDGSYVSKDSLNSKGTA